MLNYFVFFGHACRMSSFVINRRDYSVLNNKKIESSFTHVSDFVDTLDDINNSFLSDLHDVSMSVDMLIELDNFIETLMMR